MTIRNEAAPAFGSPCSVLVLVGGLFAVAIVAYWPTSSALWRFWEHSWDGEQGFLVAGLALYLVFRTRHALAAAPKRPAYWAIPFLLLLSLASVLFWKAGLEALHLLLLPVLIFLAVLGAFGTGAALTASVPLGFLYFGMPAWSVLAAPLQQLTLQVVGFLAPVLGLPAAVAGTLVTFPNGAAFEVTRECGGAGFLVQSLAVATLIGELEHSSLGRRTRLLAGVALIALAANWVRVLALIAIGYSTGMRHVIVARDHLLFGGMLFALVLVGFVWMVSRAPMDRHRPEVAAAAAPPPLLLGGYLAAIVALIATPLLVWLLVPARDQDASRAALPLASPHAAWRGSNTPCSETWRPEFVGLHTEQCVVYADTVGRKVEVLAIGYTMQQQDRELVNEGNSLLDRAGPEIVGAGSVAAGRQHYTELVTEARGGQRAVIWYIYDIGGRTFVTPILSQLWYGVRSLRSPPYSVLFAFRAACMPSCAVARDTLAIFARAMGAELVATAAVDSR